MESNKNIWLVTGDVGFNILDPIRNNFPERFLNCGSSEQAGIDICVGLALCEKIPFFYSITPFALYRPFESIRNYLDHERIAVKIVGTGRDKDYGDLGFSHWAEEDKKVMKIFKHIESYWPDTKEEIPLLIQSMIDNIKPCYLNLKR